MKNLILSLSVIIVMGGLNVTTANAHDTKKYFTNENIGRVIGTGLGSVLGSKVGKGRGNDVAIAAGAVGGYILGGKIGRDWNSKKKRYASSAPRRGYRPPITTMPRLDHIDQPYYATTSSNVRGGPSTQYVVVDNLYPAERVQVIGRVANKNWYMVEQNGIVTGFVHTSLLKPIVQYVYNH